MKPIIIVPYRDREEHLRLFLTHMHKHYSDMHICIVEQDAGKPFNRAKLLNIGFLENPNYSHYIFHDIDMLPSPANYEVWSKANIVQLVKSDIQKKDYLGGVTRFKKEAFEMAGGYNNDYYHRAEDNEMFFNLQRLGMWFIDSFQKFRSLAHERKGPEFDPALWQKAQLKRNVQNQLSICEYTVIQTKEIGNITHITVNC